jgi:DEAD/DEAH box helicase domain-containing protein
MAGDFLTTGYPDYQGQVKEYLTLDEREARTIPATEILPIELAAALPHDLYVHQAMGLIELAADNDICVTTSTASGKTLIYALHIARRAYENPDSTALLIYPTKALSRDQQRELEHLYETLGLDLEVGVYDGDVDRDEKQRLRSEADVIITNFAGLNYYLPYHRSWASFFSNLETVVIDEAHTYTGTQGIHVAWTLRRLLRIVGLQYYNSQPRLILTSATIGNPDEHATALTGRDVTVISEDGSPIGVREVALWNPPRYVGDDGITKRTSPHTEASRVSAHLAQMDAQVIMFVPSRRLTEQCANWTRERLEDAYNRHDIRVEPYHAGHTKTERREIEDALKTGAIDVVVSTSALEVGIDVGSVDACVISGYPGTRMSLWQQLGRAGRRSRGSLAVVVAKNDAIDQYIVSNPSYLFETEMEDAVVDLTNTYVAERHLLAAANEHTLKTNDHWYFGRKLPEYIHPLTRDGLLKGTLETGLKYNGPDRPETDINLYTTSAKSYSLTIDHGTHQTSLPDADAARAYREFHPGAIYLHRGETYQVTDFSNNGPQGTIELKPTNVSYYTQASRTTEITGTSSHEHTELTPGLTVHRGTGTIREHYPTYTKVNNNGDRETGFKTGLSTPLEITTDMLWLEVQSPLRETIEAEGNDDLLGAMHAVEHGLIKLAPTELTVESGDLGGTTVPRHTETGHPTTFIYDAMDGGLGFSHALYNSLKRLSTATETLYKTCKCESNHGCPACTMDSRCGDNNEPLNVNGALTLLQTYTKES